MNNITETELNAAFARLNQAKDFEKRVAAETNDAREELEIQLGWHEDAKAELKAAQKEFDEMYISYLGQSEPNSVKTNDDCYVVLRSSDGAILHIYGKLDSEADHSRWVILRGDNFATRFPKRDVIVFGNLI